MSAVPKKKEEQVKTVEKLMTRITKDLSEEMARIEEPAKTEENPEIAQCHGGGPLDKNNS
ncbi:hypothetical protein KKI11_00960 [bacterium]|nr:hypothetical protein [bacterium]